MWEAKALIHLFVGNEVKGYLYLAKTTALHPAAYKRRVAIETDIEPQTGGYPSWKVECF